MRTYLKTFIILILGVASSIQDSHARQTEKFITKVALAGTSIKTTFNRAKGNPSYLQGPYKQQIGGVTLTGQYENGQRTGIWESKMRGEIVQQYNYSNHDYLFEKPTLIVDRITQLDTAGNPVKELQKRNPYLGGDQKMIEILVSCIRYPGDAQKNDIQGKPTFKFTLTADGKVENLEATSKIGYGLEDETLRVFKLMPNDWIPVEVDGKAVDVKIDMHFSFSLSHLNP